MDAIEIFGVVYPLIRDFVMENPGFVVAVLSAIISVRAILVSSRTSELFGDVAGTRLSLTNQDRRRRITAVRAFDRIVGEVDYCADILLRYDSPSPEAFVDCPRLLQRLPTDSQTNQFNAEVDNIFAYTSDREELNRTASIFTRTMDSINLKIDHINSLVKGPWQYRERVLCSVLIQELNDIVSELVIDNDLPDDSVITRLVHLLEECRANYLRRFPGLFDPF